MTGQTESDSVGGKALLRVHRLESDTGSFACSVVRSSASSSGGAA
jgi:hypothetical protein